MKSSVRLMVIGLLMGVMVLSQPVFARIGETPEECMKRYGEPVRTKEFDPSIVACIRIGDLKDDVYRDKTALTREELNEENKRFLKEEENFEFVPTKVCEYKAGEWTISVFFGKLNVNDKVKIAAMYDSPNFEWEGERAMGITFTKSDATQFEKEVLVSVINKQFDGPMGNGFPVKKRTEEYEKEIKENTVRLNSDPNNENNKGNLKNAENNLARWKKEEADFKEKVVNSVLENYEKIRGGGSVAVSVGDYSVGKYYVNCSNKALKIAIISGRGFDGIDSIDVCIKKYARAKKELEEAIANAASKAKGKSILKESEKALGTEGL